METERGTTLTSTRRPQRWSLDLFGAAYDRLDRDNANGLAASLAFGALLSLAPLLLVVLGLASLALGEGAARAQLESLMRDALGSRGVSLVDQLIDDARAWSGGATVIGLIIFLLGAARLVSLVDGAFDIIFHVPHPPKKPTWMQQVHAYFATQLKSLGVTLGAGVLMVASMVVRALSESLFGDMESGASSIIWLVGRELVSILAWTLALAVVYRTLPPVRLDRGDVLYGAFVSAVLVSATLLVLRWGAGFLDFGAAYGAASAIVGTLITLYIVSQLFLFGAELTAELAARRRGELPSIDIGARSLAPIGSERPA